MKTVLVAESIYGANTQKGLVQLTFEDKKIICSPEEARAFAFSILEAAEGAVTDEFLMHWLAEAIGSDQDMNIRLLREFRIFRDQRRAEKEWEGGKG